MKTFIEYIEKWHNEIPNTIAIREENKNYTYKELYEKIINIQNSQTFLNMGKNSNVLYVGAKNCNMIAFCISLFGLGIPVIIGERQYEVDKFNSIVTEANIRYIIFDEYIIIGNVKYENKDIGILKIIDLKICSNEKIILDNKSNHAIKINQQRKVYLNPTSGTTGKIKIINMEEYKIIENAKAINQIFPLKHEDCYLCILPEYMHPHEIYSRPLVAGSAMSLVNTKKFYRIHKYIRLHNVTQIFGVPSQYLAILEMPIKEKVFCNVDFVFAGGEKSSNYLKKEFLKKFRKRIVTFWGSSETGGSTLYYLSDEDADEENIIGIPFPGYTVKISEDGYLMIKGKACFDGYMNAGLSNIDNDAFYNTHDIVEENAGGVYTYIARKDNIFKINGKKVSLQAINMYLSKNNLLKDFYTCVVENKKGKKVLFIYLVLVENKENEIYEYIHKYMNRSIKYNVMVMKKLPKTKNLKTDIKKLKERALLHIEE